MRKSLREPRRVTSWLLASSIVLGILFLFIFAPVAFAASSRHFSLVGPKKYYLALGDSLAFGFQPDLNFDDGYADDFFSNLRARGTQQLANLACPGETSATMINGKCPYPYLRKYFYLGAQLNAAIHFLRAHAGQVSPVTLDIGANDLLRDINTKTCQISATFNSDLASVDNNLAGIILPQLQSAMRVNGAVSGDILVMNYYYPYQNICPHTVSLEQEINQHIANDVQGFGTLIDVFGAFGGAQTPNANICTYTWMCSIFKDIHATNKGYSVIASAFENGAGY